jgi:hypothetical protein
MGNSGIYIAIVIVVIIALAIFAYEKGWLNSILPAKWQKQTATQKAGFVGAYGRTPEMQNCLAFPGPLQRWTNFNRCIWV